MNAASVNELTQAIHAAQQTRQTAAGIALAVESTVVGPLRARVAELEQRLTPMPDDELAAVRAREAAATPGPWCTDDWEIYQGVDYEAGAEWIGETCRAVGRSQEDRANAAFIAAARTDIPVLLAEVARLRRALGEAADTVAELESEVGGWSARHAAEQARAEQLSRQLAAVRDATAEAVMCGDGPCLVGTHLPKLEQALGGVGLLRDAEGGERP